MSKGSGNVPGKLPNTDAYLQTTQPEHLSIEQAVYARKEEYTSVKTARIKIGSWNVGSFSSTEEDLGKWFTSQSAAYRRERSPVNLHDAPQQVLKAERNQKACCKGIDDRKDERDESSLQCRISHASDVDLYILGLQEIVDLNSAIQTLKHYSDFSAAKRFKTAVEKCLPSNFELIAEKQLVGLLLLIYARSEITPQLQYVSTAEVGTGLMGFGNKGAVSARLVLGESTGIVFVNCHLSSGAGKADTQKRNADIYQIVSRTRFGPAVDHSSSRERLERLGDEDYAFLFGDLNYRIESSLPAADIRRILALHLTGAYGVERSNSPKDDADASGTGTVGALSTDETAHSKKDDFPTSFFDLDQNPDDPTSLRATLNSLLPHDELHRAQMLGQALQDGWREAPITFLPTYKYDIGSATTFDSSDKKRSPSWCDRILYRTRSDRLLYNEKTRAEEQAKLRDDQLKGQGIDRAADDENAMFEYDPETDGDENLDETSRSSGTWDPSEFADQKDTIQVERYLSHQNISSSDHKPLDCVFNLTFDAIDFALKSEVYNQVAREIDRAENENRPTVTVIMEEALHDDVKITDGIDFGAITYDNPKSLSITIANTGQVPAQCSFSQESSTTALSGAPLNWISIHTLSQRGRKEDSLDLASESITLDPGESASVGLLLHVKDKELVKALNQGFKLDNVIILSVRGGKDHFYSFRAFWQSSVHGRSIYSLIRIPEGGIRALETSYQGLPDELPILWSAPREIFKLTEAIETLVERTVAELDMLGVVGENNDAIPFLRINGWPFMTNSWTLDSDARRKLRIPINEALDSDRSFDAIHTGSLPLHRLEAFAEVLLDFLDNLVDGVVPQRLWAKIEAEFFTRGKSRTKLSNEEKRAAILEFLASSPPHSISFVLLTSTLARVSQDVCSSSIFATSEPQESPRAKAQPKALADGSAPAKKRLVQRAFAVVFANLLVRSADLPSKSKALSDEHKCELLEIFFDSSS